MKPLVLAAFLFALLAPLGARAAVPDDIEVVRYVRVPTQGPVVLNGLGGAGRLLDSLHDIGPSQYACVSFTNNDARTAKSVRVQLVFYDGHGDRSDGTLLTRNGTFSTGVHERSTDRNSDRIRRENCVSLHRPRYGFSAIVGYVDRVEFSDGSSWTSSNVRLADHVAPGSGNVAYAFTDAAPGAPVEVASSGELAPLFLGTSASCAQTQVRPRPNSLFDPAVLASVAPARNVFVNAQTGAPAVGELFAIGDATVCKPSGNAPHDAAALQIVRQSRVSIRQPQVFRVYFPALSSSPGCTDDVRLLNRVLVNATPTIELSHPPKPGEYVAIVHVGVDAAGRPVDVSVAKSAGPPEFDDAARRSALASRFWPAMAAGKPVLSSFDFAMRWVIDPTREPADINRHDYTLTRVFGPPLKAAAAGCAA